MTPAEAEAIMDAVVECRHTSRQLMAADDGIVALAAENADDAAFQHVQSLIKAATQ